MVLDRIYGMRAAGDFAHDGTVAFTLGRESRRLAYEERAWHDQPMASPQDYRVLRALDSAAERAGRLASFATRLWARGGAWKAVALPLIPVQYLLWAAAYAVYVVVFMAGAMVGLVLIGIAVAAVGVVIWQAIKLLTG